LTDVGRMQGGQHDLLAAVEIHLLADDVLDLEAGELPQRNHGIVPSGESEDEAAANEKAMNGSLVHSGINTEGGAERVGPSDLMQVNEPLQCGYSAIWAPRARRSAVRLASPWISTSCFFVSWAISAALASAAARRASIPSSTSFRAS